jgi:hypothetical protein
MLTNLMMVMGKNVMSCNNTECALDEALSHLHLPFSKAQDKKANVTILGHIFQGQ